MNRCRPEGGQKTGTLCSAVNDLFFIPPYTEVNWGKLTNGFRLTISFSVMESDMFFSSAGVEGEGETPAARIEVPNNRLRMIKRRVMFTFFFKEML